ncbi:hypothetical protein LWF01_17475 [Saxibacter everestensis]|uniref:DUF4145 domain-containing protein n=1 Tax=Saxibacter everestensis TaxID=2909229 RepID=A0ABY8QSQ2_9MICO|nr:hypothetical protein LWF01_17475 [Brevibacteriaceae bacterium ZFBP1038]
MSGFEFTASLVGSLAWPLVVLAVATLFRRQLATLLARPFTTLKAGPLEVVWSQEVAEIEANLGEPALEETRRLDSARPSEQLAEIARIAPAAAVLQAFAQVEAQLRQLLIDAGLATGRGSATQLVRRAHEAGLVQVETVKAVEGIAMLRNLAAHGHETGLDEARALDYLALTDAVSYALTQGRNGPPGSGTAAPPPQTRKP